MYRWVAVSLVVLAAGFTTGWKTQGWRLGQEIATIRNNHATQIQELQATALAAEQKYREQEAQTARMLAAAREKSNAEIRRINARHTATVNSLRNRPERADSNSNSQVPSAPTPCAGSTGAELARGDAEFLAGYAADAARLEAALEQCISAYNALRN